MKPSVFSRSWFRVATVVVLGVLVFAMIYRGSTQGGGRGPGFFYSRVAVPISPSEVIVIKKSGETPVSYTPSVTDVYALRNDSGENESAVGYMLDRERLASGALHVVPGAIAIHRDQSPFQLLPALAPMVEFWRRIFSVYGKQQVVLHHRDHLELVYAVLDFEAVSAARLGRVSGYSALDEKRLRYLAIDVEQSRVMNRIRVAERNGQALSAPEQAVLLDPELIRAQTGIRERFARAIERSGLYMPYIEAIFNDAGLPVELSRLPFIESSFEIEATSSVGAAGIWQFMEETGRLYLRVDDDVDERRDPLRATEAVVQFLKHTYDIVGEWPLAVNAYNTGAGRINQAKKALGTRDVATIIKNFKHPSYQFASRNFYPEFLAAILVYENRARDFPDITLMPPIRFDVLVLPVDVSMVLLSRSNGVSIDELKSLNPSLADHFFSGERLLRRGMTLKVPYRAGERFQQWLARGAFGSEAVGVSQ